VGVRIVIGSAQPSRIQPLPLGQWRAGRHHATRSGSDEFTTADYGQNDANAQTTANTIGPSQEAR